MSIDYYQNLLIRAETVPVPTDASTDATAPASPSRVTGEELERAKRLLLTVENRSLRVEMSVECRALRAAAAELEQFQAHICEKYGVTAPVQIGDDGTITSDPNEAGR